MQYLYVIFKSFLDPIFIVFFLLLLSLFISVIKNKKKSGALILFLSIVILYGASIFPVANNLCYYLEKDYINNPAVGDKNIDVIVVLGGGSQDINSLKNTFPNEVTSVRLFYAIDVYDKTGAKYFVCSGKGNGKVSEAEVMAKLAEKLGVPKEKIKIESNSRNTWESASELNKMFVNKNINVGLVTSAFHMKRSEREFKKYFNNVLPLPANYLYSSPMGNTVIKYIPQAGEPGRTVLAIREIVGQIWYNIRS